MKSFVSACLALSLMAGVQSVSVISYQGPQGVMVNVTNPGLNVSIYRQVSSAAPTTLPPTTPPPSTTPAVAGASSTTTATTTTTTTAKPTMNTAMMPGNTGYINLTVSGLRELDKSGVAVTQVGHLVGSVSLTTQMFNSSSSVYPVWLSPSVYASCVQYMASPLNSLNSTTTTFNATICTTSTAGSITTSTEYEPVLVGQVIVYFGVNLWQWSITGTSLEVNVTLMVASGRAITSTRPGNATSTMRCGFSSNNDAFADVSGMVTSDGMIKPQVNLPSLTLTPGGASVSVSVRLPTFQTSSAFYVLMEPGYMVVKGGPGAVQAAPKMQATSVLAIVVSLIMSAVVLVN